MGKIKRIKKEIAEAFSEAEKIGLQIEKNKAEAKEWYAAYKEEVENQLTDGFLKIKKQTPLFDEQQPSLWREELWKDYKPILSFENNKMLDRLLVGEWVLPEYADADDAGNCISYPAYIPFFGKQKTIIIKETNETKDSGIALVRALIQRLHSLIPHYSQFTLLDPETMGAAFPMQRELNTRISNADVFYVLSDIMKDMKRINVISALTEEDYFTKKVQSLTMNEKYEFIFAANFPNGYDAREIERLAKIGNTGYISGKYLFIEYNVDEEMPRDMNLDLFKDAIILDVSKKNSYNTFVENGREIVEADCGDATPELWRDICKHLEQFKPEDRQVTWKEYIDLPEDKIWSYSAKEILETTIGDEGGKPLNVWFGKKEGANCAHGMLAATTGAGKSNFYHALILGLAQRYSPNELRMYLVDGKNGVEFEAYRSFPHAEVVSLKSSSELTGSIIEELCKVVERRNELFKRNGCNSYDEYRARVKKELPRILLVIDEYQVLFEGKDAGKSSDGLRLLSTQARSAGIHMMLGSQRFSVPNMQNKDSIFGNIQLRIAMKMTQDDRISLTEFGREGKDFIASCDLPGQIVINQNSGSDDANKLGKVAYIEREEKEEITKSIINRSKEKGITSRLMQTILFEGDSDPNLDENPQLMKLATLPAHTTALDLQKMARKPEYDGGFGQSEWNVSEHPIILWLGQCFNVYGQACMIHKRRKMENALLVGDRNASRYGMLVSSLFSIICNKKQQEDVSFYIYDRSLPGTDWNPYLKRFCDEALLPNGYETHFSNKVKGLKEGLKTLDMELSKRLKLDQDERQDLKPIYLVITEPDDVEELNLEVDNNGFRVDSELGALLKHIYINGSQAGIHVLLSSSGVIPLMNVISKKDLLYFRHRISLQISEQESFDFLQCRNGSQLQSHGDIPTVGYYIDINGSKRYKFKPYSIKDDNFEAQFKHLVKLCKRN